MLLEPAPPLLVGAVGPQAKPLTRYDYRLSVTIIALGLMPGPAWIATARWVLSR